MSLLDKTSNFLMHGGLGGVFVPFAHGLEGQFGLLHARSIRCSQKFNPDCARTGVAQGLGPVLGAPGTTPTRQQRLYTPEYPACIPYLHLSFITTSLPTLSSAWIFGAPIRIPTGNPGMKSAARRHRLERFAFSAEGSMARLVRQDGGAMEEERCVVRTWSSCAA